MDHISGFFSRYLSPLLKQEHTKTIAAETCSEVLGVIVEPHQISIRSGVCVITQPQSVKHQIFLKQNQLLERFSQVKSLSRITQVR